MQTIKRLGHRRDRLRKELDKYDELYKDGATPYNTYHAGFNVGYAKGKLAEIEDLIDDLKASINKNAL